MSPPTALTVSRVEPHRSRELISDSRARIASAQEKLHRASRALARQKYLQIVCAWCQRTMRWQRTEGAVWGQISYSICFDCFSPVFWELDAVNTPPFPRGHAA